MTEAELAAILSLASGEPPPRIVKVSPGDDARFWDACLAGGFACVEGWDALGDLAAFDDEAAFQSAFHEAFAARHDGDEAATAKKAAELWTFRELEPGDLVIANRGTSEVLAVGEVVEPGYAFQGDRGEAKHTVSVRWDASKACQIPKQAYWANVTVADVPAELYRAILAGPKAPAKETKAPKRDQDDAGDTTPVTFEDIARVLRDDGLSYSDETLAAYLLGLEAKRFVLLTGISGTGKTQLALSVAKALGGGAVAEGTVPRGPGRGPRGRRGAHRPALHAEATTGSSCPSAWSSAWSSGRATRTDPRPRWRWSIRAAASGCASRATTTAAPPTSSCATSSRTGSTRTWNPATPSTWRSSPAPPPTPPTACASTSPPTASPRRPTTRATWSSPCAPTGPTTAGSSATSTRCSSSTWPPTCSSCSCEPTPSASGRARRTGRPSPTSPSSTR